MMRTYLGIAIVLGLMSCSAATSRQAAAADGEPELMYQKGMEYGLLDEVGQPADIEKARHWLGLAAAQDYLPAIHALGWIHLQGIGIERDRRQAYQHFRRAALQGYADSQYMLGILYAQGWGVDSSSTDSLYWVREAAQQGHSEAQTMLKGLFSPASQLEQDALQ